MRKNPCGKMRIAWELMTDGWRHCWQYITCLSLRQIGEKAMEPRPKKLLEQVDDAIRLMHYSPRTGETYAHWIRRFILFHDKRHPKDMGAAEVQAFLTHLAIDQNVAASTQNQALSALLFLYRQVLHQPLDLKVDAVRARKPEHLPTVLSKDEVRRILDKMSGVQKLMAQLLYGTGMRVSEGVQLRVKDIDFDQHEILVRDAKGMKDRVTMLPDSLARQQGWSDGLRGRLVLTAGLGEMGAHSRWPRPSSGCWARASTPGSPATTAARSPAASAGPGRGAGRSARRARPLLHRPGLPETRP